MAALQGEAESVQRTLREAKATIAAAQALLIAKQGRVAQGDFSPEERRAIDDLGPATLITAQRLADAFQAAASRLETVFGPLVSDLGSAWSAGDTTRSGEVLTTAETQMRELRALISADVDSDLETARNLHTQLSALVG